MYVIISFIVIHSTFVFLALGAYITIIVTTPWLDSRLLNAWKLSIYNYSYLLHVIIIPSANNIWLFSHISTKYNGLSKIIIFLYLQK